jgi:hypothetical protein
LASHIKEVLGARLDALANGIPMRQVVSGVFQLGRPAVGRLPY